MIREATLSKEELKALDIVPGTTRFRESALAHRYLDGLTGIELGPSSHNSFGLAGSIAVAPIDDDGGRDSNFYRNQQIMMCGAYAVVDVDAEAHKLPFESDSWDYVISSHVVEHFPDPISAFREWNRILKDSGIVFMIVPLHGALEADKPLPLSEADEIVSCIGVTVDTWDYEAKPIPGGRRGHYHRYTWRTLDSFIAHLSGLNWELIDHEEVDTKVGNGFTLVYRVHKEIEPRELAEGEMLQSVEVEMPIEISEEAKAVIADAVAELQPEQIVRRKPGRKAKSS